MSDREFWTLRAIVYREKVADCLRTGRFQGAWHFMAEARFCERLASENGKPPF